MAVRRFGGGVVGVMVVLAVLSTGAAGANDVDVVISQAATVSASARRLTPPTTAPPPTGIDDWRDGAVAGCNPGQTLRGVDTSGRKLVTFTFDDGPDRQWTDVIMTHFERRGARATFFVVGIMADKAPNILRSMIDRGFEVGNHTVTHTYRHSTIAAEIPAMNAQLLQRFGIRTPYFRAPGLASGPLITAAAARAGMCILSMNASGRDAEITRRTAAEICMAVTTRLKPGAIVLLHDGGHRKATANAVPCMLDAAIARGYKIVTLAELLASGPPEVTRSRSLVE